MTDTWSVFAEHMELDPTSAGSPTTADTADGTGAGEVVGVGVGVADGTDVVGEVLGDDM